MRPTSKASLASGLRRRRPRVNARPKPTGWEGVFRGAHGQLAHRVLQDASGSISWEASGSSIGHSSPCLLNRVEAQDLGSRVSTAVCYCGVQRKVKDGLGSTCFTRQLPRARGHKGNR